MTPESPVPREGLSMGLQAERTYLAWQRTGLSFLGSGALLLRIAWSTHHWLLLTPGLFGMLIGAVTVARGLLRYRAATVPSVRDLPIAIAHAMMIVALGAAVLCISGLVVISVTP